MRIRKLVIVVGLVMSANDGRADLMPGDPGCVEPPGAECVVGSLEREAVDADPCTSKEVKRLGLRFHCARSHNDRGETWWCRPRRLPKAPKEAPNASEAQQDAYWAKQAEWRKTWQREFGSVERELSFGSYAERYWAESAARRMDGAVSRDPMRFDCFALAEKYRRCSLEADRCGPYWTKYKELVGSEFGLQEYSPGSALEAMDLVDNRADASPDGANPIPDATPPGDASPPSGGDAADLRKERTPARSCVCDVIGPPSGRLPWTALVALVALLLWRRR